jgi:hypothetical protein
MADQEPDRNKQNPHEVISEIQGDQNSIFRMNKIFRLKRVAWKIAYR